MRAFISSHRLGQHIGKMRNRCAPPPPYPFSVSLPPPLPVSQCLPPPFPFLSVSSPPPSRFSVSPSPLPISQCLSPPPSRFSVSPPSPFMFLSVSPPSLHFSQCPPPHTPPTPRLCSRGSRTFHFTHIHCFPIPSSDTERRAAWTATETRSFTAGWMTLLRP